MRITFVSVRERRRAAQTMRPSSGPLSIGQHLPLPSTCAEAWGGASSRVSPRPWMSIMWGKSRVTAACIFPRVFLPLAPGPCVLWERVKSAERLLAHAKTRIRFCFPRNVMHDFELFHQSRCRSKVVRPISNPNGFQSLFQTPANKTLEVDAGLCRTAGEPSWAMSPSGPARRSVASTHSSPRRSRPR